MYYKVKANEIYFEGELEKYIYKPLGDVIIKPCLFNAKELMTNKVISVKGKVDCKLGFFDNLSSSDKETIEKYGSMPFIFEEDIKYEITKRDLDSYIAFFESNKFNEYCDHVRCLQERENGEILTKKAEHKYIKKKIKEVRGKYK